MDVPVVPKQDDECQVIEKMNKSELQEEDLEDVPVTEVVVVPLPPGASATVTGKNCTKLVVRRPAHILCPYCNEKGMTSVEHVYGATVLCASTTLCLSCWPLTCLPFLVPPCKRTIHRCRRCNKVVGLIEPSVSARVWVASLVVLSALIFTLLVASGFFTEEPS